MVIAGRYQVARTLGRGAFGSVVLAHDPELGRTVAIKLLHDEKPGRDLLARFRREATVTARLRSPHVVRVYDHGEDEGRPFVVYEFIEGEDLRHRQAQGGILRGRAIEWALQGCAGLAEVHAAGVVHRDLKPENVILRADGGELVLCDFGLAGDEQAHTILTRTGQGSMGTPLYISLEQLDGEAGPASDQFSWALVIYELLAGRPLRESEGVFQRLAGLLATREHELPPEAKELLGPLDTPLRRALEPEAAFRYPDIQTFAMALADAAGLAPEAPRVPPAGPEVAREAEPADAPAPPVPTAPPRPPPAPTSSRRWLLGAATLGVALVAGWWTTPRPTPAPPSPPPSRRTIPEAVLQAYRRLAGPLLGADGALRSDDLGPEDQAWVLDARLPLRWRAYLRALDPWLAEGRADRAVLPFVRHLPALVGDQLRGAQDQRRRTVLTDAAGGAALERASGQRRDLAAATEELLSAPRGAADLVLRATLAARGLLPPPAEGPSLTSRVLAHAGDCDLMRWARHELTVAGPSSLVPCEARRAMLAQAETCEGRSDHLVAAARIRAAKACPGEGR